MELIAKIVNGLWPLTIFARRSVLRHHSEVCINGFDPWAIFTKSSKVSCRSGVFIVNFEHILDFFLGFQLLTW